LLFLSNRHGRSTIRSGDIKRAIEAGDHTVERIVRDAARWLGVGIANIVHLLAPDIVLLGGGLIEALPRLMLEFITDSAMTHVMPAFHETFEIAASQPG